MADIGGGKGKINNPSGGGHLIQDEGTNLTQRAKLNFTGASIAATDNSSTGATDVSVDIGAIPGADLYVAGHLYPAEHQGTPTWTTGKLNGCIQLSDTYDYFKVLGKDALNAGYTVFSVDGWVYLDDVSNNMWWFDKRNVHNTQKVFGVQFNNPGGGDIRVVSDVGVWNTTNTPLSFQTWHHVTVTYDNANSIGGNPKKVRFWVDGTEVDNANTSESSVVGGAFPTPDDYELFIGSIASSPPSQTFKGRLDQLNFWSIALDQTAIDAQYNSGNGTESTDADMIFSYDFNDGDEDDSSTIIARNDIVPTSAGDDTNEGTSSGAALRTLQAAIDKVPEFFSGDVTIHVAGGTLLDSGVVKGYHPNGPYSLTILGYANRVPNIFSDSVLHSGVFTKTATGNFPDVTNSLVTDSGKSFSTEVVGTLLQTVDANDFDWADWHPIENSPTTDQLSVVTRWGPRNLNLSGQVYRIYDPQDFPTIHGKNYDSYPFTIEDSSSVQFHKMGFRKGVLDGCKIVGSYLRDVSGNSFRDNGFNGLQLFDTYLERLSSCVATNNVGHGMVLIHGSQVDNLRNNFAYKNVTGLLGGGFGGYSGSSVDKFQINLAKENWHAGYDFEAALSINGFRLNRADTNARRGVVLGGNTVVDFTNTNYITNHSGVDTEGPHAGVRTLGPGAFLVSSSSNPHGIVNNNIGLAFWDQFFWFQDMGGKSGNYVYTSGFFDYTGNDVNVVGGVEDVVEIEDFVGGNVSHSGAVGKLNWAFRKNLSGSINNGPNHVANHPGLIRLSTGTGSGAWALLDLANNDADQYFAGDEFFDVVIQLAMVQADTQTGMIIGMVNTNTDETPGNGYYFEKDFTDTTWHAVTNGTSSTDTDTGVTIDTDWVTFRIINYVSDIHYYINGTLQAQHNTNLTSTVLAPRVLIINNAASNKRVDIDKIAFRVSPFRTPV